MLTAGIIKERFINKVAIVPDHIESLKEIGLDIWVETGAGSKAFYADEAYKNYATITPRSKIIGESDILITVEPPDREELLKRQNKALTISQFRPFLDDEIRGIVRSNQITALSLDMLPRTTIAQSMDVLSSMASIAGYRAVIEAASLLPRYFPMMITAAGSIKPAKVVVLGAGVAGLQAIATAKRLGAIVEAFDVRSAAKEEVLSLGAKFIEVEGAAEDKEAGGYAVEQSEEFLKRQQDEVQNRAKAADVIITTAQVRGKKAPVLVPRETVESMKAGSVVVDLAASTGGNCELTKDGKTIVHNDVYIVGDSDLPDKMPLDSSFLFSRNVINILKMLIVEGELQLDMENVIISSSLI